MTRVMAIGVTGILLTSGLIGVASTAATAAAPALAPLTGPDVSPAAADDPAAIALASAAPAATAQSTEPAAGRSLSAPSAIGSFGSTTLTSTGPAAISAGQSAPAAVKGSYIVVLKRRSEVTSAVLAGRRAGASVTHTYSSVLAGYSATMTNVQLDQVRRDPAVDHVEQNVTVHVAGETQKRLDTWGLDRIDQRKLPLNDAYYYNATGKGVTAYVIDTGIDASHPDFAHVSAGVDEVGSSGTGEVDCDGHGTHVSGTIGGTFFGVAKGVTLVPVRVLDCAGNGDADNILAGLQWVDQNHATPAVANLSLEATDPQYTQSLNDAVQTLINDGVSVVVAAGNDSTNACSVAPASLPAAITVAASTIKDRAASFSNYGSCVDVYAPGEEITSDWPADSHGVYRIAVLDGTSMAAPHVTGTVALYLEKNPTATPAQVSAWITSNATANKVVGVKPAYPHSLLFSPETVSTPSGISSGDRLLSGQNLVRGARLYSVGQKYFLAYRSKDGWLSLYNAASGEVVWSSGHSGVWTNMNTSGSLSSYDSYGRRAWSTNTAQGASTMIVNPKGYLMVKRNSDGRILWTSPH